MFGWYTDYFLSDLLILDIRDVNNISFVHNFPFDSRDFVASSNNTDANITQPNNGQTQSIGPGVIAGIAIGGVAAVSLKR